MKVGDPCGWRWDRVRARLLQIARAGGWFPAGGGLWSKGPKS